MTEQATHEALAVRLFLPERSLYVAPIRHHSPACAWAVRELLRAVRPRQVLVEMPVDLAVHVETLQAEQTKPPVAIAVLIDRAKRPRLAAYYPFCAHSPEYVAFAEARALGAEVSFIDLPAAHEAMLARGDAGRPVAHRDEAYFDSGDYVAELCRELGCRNGYELWDHLFESRLGGADFERFFAEVGTYCAALRAATPAEIIQGNGDLAREAHMREALAAALEREGPVAVVVGGFHAPALLEHVDVEPARATRPGRGAGRRGREEPPPAASAGEAAGCRSYLIRYGFAALDALSGYAAGLPQPGYYDYLWRRANEAAGTPPWGPTAIDLVSDFTARSRREGRDISVPAQVEIVRAAEGLARLRGRPGAMRYDLIDAVRAALVKGEASGREAWTERLLEFLRGDAIGDIPASAGSPPLVEDARRRARALRIDVGDGARRMRRLDIRRKASHLAASRYFHAMTLLETGFAERTSGPDFLHGVHTERLFEEWSYAWSPQVEGRLIEAAAYADDLPRACVAALDARRAALEEAGRARDLAAMADLLAQGLLAGLGRELAPFLKALSADIQAHADFTMVAHALEKLHHIARSSGPLGAPKELELEDAREAAYLRLVHLCDDLPETPDEAIGGRLEALRLVTELLRSGDAPELDPELFDAAIDRVAAARTPPEIKGAVLAICVQAGRRDEAELSAALTGSFEGTVDKEEERIGVLRGMLHAAPDLLWRAEGVLGEVDRLLCALPEDRFLALLPHIRLAFSMLHPRESDRVAAMLARLHGGETADFTPERHAFTDHDLERGLRVESWVRESLEADGLASAFFCGDGA